MAEIFGPLDTAGVEVVSSDPATFLFIGRIIYNSSDAKFKIYNGSGWKELSITDLSQTLANKTLTSPVINTGVSGTAIKDEDDLLSDSDTHLITQQSAKAYIDSGDNLQVSKTGDTMTGNLVIDNAKEIRFSETDANGSHYIGLKAPDNVTANVTLSLPDGAGTNGYALTTNGTDTLAWSAVATVSNNETQAKAADYTITDSDNARTILMTTSNTARTVTLPTAADNAYRTITIKKVDSGTGSVTIDGEGVETIDGATAFIMYTQYMWIAVQSDGTSWHIIDRGNESATIALENQYTGGDILITKVGTQVMITGVSDATHSSNSSPESSSGFIPTWARPAAIQTNLFNTSTGGNITVRIESDGTLGTFLRDWSGSLSAGINSERINISYNVAD